MNDLTFEEKIVYCKMCLVLLGNKSISFSDTDRKIAYDVLKKMTDNISNWTEEQKEQFKDFIEEVKYIEELQKSKIVHKYIRKVIGD